MSKVGAKLGQQIKEKGAAGMKMESNAGGIFTTRLIWLYVKQKV